MVRQNMIELYEEAKQLIPELELIIKDNRATVHVNGQLVLETTGAYVNDMLYVCFGAMVVGHKEGYLAGMEIK